MNRSFELRLATVVEVAERTAVDDWHADAAASRALRNEPHLVGILSLPGAFYSRVFKGNWLKLERGSRSRVFSLKINRQDKALLDRQLWAGHPHPSRFISLGFAALFLGGIMIGFVLFAGENKQTYVSLTDLNGTFLPR